MNTIAHPLTLVGGALFCLGVLIVLILLIMHDGMRRSTQIARLGELWSGGRGVGAQRSLRLGLVAVGLGAVLAFSGVAAKDANRAQACRDHCAREGFDDGKIGPNSDRTKDRSTWFVACICASPDRPNAEVRANDLVASPPP